MYLASRSMERGNAAAADIKKETGVTGNKLVVAQLDLGSKKSIKQFVDNFKKSKFLTVCLCFKSHLSHRILYDKLSLCMKTQTDDDRNLDFMLNQLHKV